MLGKLTTRSVFLLGAMLFSVSALAQEHVNTTSNTEGPLLSEHEAVVMGLNHSRPLQSFQYQLAAQRQRAASAGSQVRNPELRLGDLSTRYFDSEVTNQELEIGLRWKPPKLGELDQAQEEETVGLWEDKVKQWEARRDLIVSIREAYATLAMLQMRHSLTERRVALLAGSLQTLTKLADLGARSSLDRLKIRRKHILAQKELVGLERRYEDESARLVALTGSPQGLRVRWDDPPLLVLDEAFLKAKLLAQHPAPRLARQRSQLSKARYWAERTSLIPWPTTVELSYHYESQQPDWGEFMVGFEIPLFNWNLGELHATDIERKQASVSSHAVKDGLEAQLLKRLGSYQQALAEYQTLRKETQDALTQTDDLVAKARGLQWPEDEILDMELENNTLRRMVLEAGYELKLAAIRLGGVLGVEQDKDLMKGDKR